METTKTQSQKLNIRLLTKKRVIAKTCKYLYLGRKNNWVIIRKNT